MRLWGVEARNVDVKQVFEIDGTSEEVRWVRAVEIDELTRANDQLVGAMGQLAKVVNNMAMQGGFANCVINVYMYVLECILLC